MEKDFISLPLVAPDECGDTDCEGSSVSDEVVSECGEATEYGKVTEYSKVSECGKATGCGDSACAGFREDFSSEDEAFMRHALALARKAEALDEVPVGAVAVKDGVIIGEGYNTRETGKCALDHAEMHAISEACKALGGWRLPGVTLYVTMEPCCMCAGAVVNARIPRVVYGTPDLRFGAFGVNEQRVAVHRCVVADAGDVHAQTRKAAAGLQKRADVVGHGGDVGLFHGRAPSRKRIGV